MFSVIFCFAELMSGSVLLSMFKLWVVLYKIKGVVSEITLRLLLSEFYIWTIVFYKRTISFHFHIVH